MQKYGLHFLHVSATMFGEGRCGISDFRLRIDERYKVQGGIKNRKGMMPCILTTECRLLDCGIRIKEGIEHRAWSIEKEIRNRGSGLRIHLRIENLLE